MSKAKGNRYELKAKAELEADGYVVTKSGGSLGAADLVALKAGEPALLVQVKATAAGPFSGFGPCERAELVDTAERAGAACELWWYASRQPVVRLKPDRWPAFSLAPLKGVA